MILHETLPLALAQPAERSSEGPSVRLSARPRTLRFRRELAPSASGRTWLLELEIELPEMDPERVLAECEGFLVDGTDGREIGVVERVETSAETGVASALLVSAGWFGRRRLRVDAHAVEVLIPDEQRVVIDESSLTPAGDHARSS